MSLRHGLLYLKTLTLAASSCMHIDRCVYVGTPVAKIASGYFSRLLKVLITLLLH